MYAPVVLFVYNRPFHTEQTLNALASNIEAVDSELYIFCDGVKIGASIEDVNNINLVKKIVRNENRFKKVNLIIRENNIGLANSILNGVTEVVNKYGKIIVLEDDIVVTKDFLYYMNKSLHIFESRKNVYHINGFNNESNLQFLLNDYYFLNFMSCWGWATWRDRWDNIVLDYSYFYDLLMNSNATLYDYNYDNVLKFHKQLEMNINGEINTWAILWYSTVYFNKGLCLTPKYSFVNNIGMDGTGVHCGSTSVYNKRFAKSNRISKEFFSKLNVRELGISRLHLKLFYIHGNEVSILKLLRLKIKSLLNKLK